MVRSLVWANTFEPKSQNRCYDVYIPCRETLAGNCIGREPTFNPGPENGESDMVVTVLGGALSSSAKPLSAGFCLPRAGRTWQELAHPLVPRHGLRAGQAAGAEGQPGSLGSVLGGAQVVGLPPCTGPDPAPATFGIVPWEVRPGCPPGSGQEMLSWGWSSASL